MHKGYANMFFPRNHFRFEKYALCAYFPNIYEGMLNSFKMAFKRN